MGQRVCYVPFPLIQPLACPHPRPKPSSHGRAHAHAAGPPTVRRANPPSACCSQRQSQSQSQPDRRKSPARRPSRPHSQTRHRPSTHRHTTAHDSQTDRRHAHGRRTFSCLCGLPLQMALEAFVGLLESPSSPAGSPSSQARLANFCLGRAYDGQAPLLENHARLHPLLSPREQTRSLGDNKTIPHPRHTAPKRSDKVR